jgi:hypothetical protein
VAAGRNNFLDPAVRKAADRLGEEAVEDLNPIFGNSENRSATI